MNPVWLLPVLTICLLWATHGAHGHGHAAAHGAHASYGHVASHAGHAAVAHTAPIASVHGSHAGYGHAAGYGHGLVSHPNGAVVPVDEPAVQAARADHLAAGGRHHY